MTAEEKLKDSYSRCSRCGLFHNTTSVDCFNDKAEINYARVGEGAYKGAYIIWGRPNS